MHAQTAQSNPCNKVTSQCGANDCAAARLPIPSLDGNQRHRAHGRCGPSQREGFLMSKYEGTQTEKNLQAAFAGESQATNKYTYFASVAKKEGFEQIAEIFRKNVGKRAVPRQDVAARALRASAPRRRTSKTPQTARTSSGRTCMRASPKPPRRRASPSLPRSSARSAPSRSITRALSRAAAQCRNRPGIRKERGQGLGMPQLRPHRGRHQGPQRLPRLQSSAGILRDQRRELLRRARLCDDKKSRP